MRSLVFAPLLASLLCTPLFADQIGVNPQVSLFGGVQSGSNELKSGAAMTAAVGARLTPYMSFDIQGGWMPTGSKEERLADADVTITSVEFVPRLYAPMGRLEPYVAAGAGRFFFGEQIDNPPGATTSVS